MRKYNNFYWVLLIAFVFGSLNLTTAQDGYKFTDVKRIDVTSVKDQHRSGTCWSFSGLGFLEAEIIRIGKMDAPDLSEMFIVRNCYMDKAIKYVRLHGSLNMGGGGAFHDVTYVLKNYGLIPEQAYTGLNYGENNHVHGELDEILKDYTDGIIKNKNKSLSTAWKTGFNGLLDAYLGKYPEKFEYKGKEYSPKSFAAETGLNADDYVTISSFTHHPYYQPFILEIPDNWLWGSVYNVKLGEMTQIIDYSLEQGYTVAWATDVSEKGFSYRDGVAIVPGKDITEMSDSERSKWEKMTAGEKEALLYSFDKPVEEKKITPEMRQEAFDNYQTTDDHGMLIVGTAKDQNGKEYYIVKNSWAESNKYNGYLYASKAFVQYKTTNIMVNKNSLSKDIRKKLEL